MTDPMYVWLWRRLPGGLPGKLAGSLALLVAVLAVLWFVAFPFVQDRLPYNDVNVGGSRPAATVTPTPSMP